MFIVAYIVLPLFQERWRAFPTEDAALRFAASLGTTYITFHMSEEE